MSEDDEWHARVVHQAAVDIGRLLEARGRISAPIYSLKLDELESIARRAIDSWIVSASRRAMEQPEFRQKVEWLFTA